MSTKPISVVPGEEYLAQGWYKTEGAPFSSKLFFRTFLASDNQQEMRFTESGTEGAPIIDRGGQWRRIFVTFKVPEDLVQPRATISFGQENYPVTVYWDDLAMMPLPKNARQFSRRLTQEQKTPTHSAEEVLKYWSNREPWNVSLPLSNKDSKSNIIKIDGKPLAPYAFVQNYGDMYWPSWAPHKDFFEAGFDFQWLVYDPNQVTKRFGGPLWKGDGDYDFGYLEKKLLELLRFYPEAKVALYVSLWTYPDFADRHPEAAWINALGEKSVGEKYEWQPESQRKPGQSLNHSIAASAFRKSAGDYLFAMGQFLNKSVVGKSIVGVHLVGGADGQWFVPGWLRDFGQYDYSEGTRVTFGNWLRKQYKNDLAAFRKAWGDDKLSFETVVMPPEKDRATKNLFLDPNRPSERRVIDANHFMYAGNCETIFYLAKSFKQGIGRPVFVTTYYPYNQLGLTEIFKQTWLDGTVSVPNYGGCREAGNFGDVATVPDSLRLHCRFFLGELDYRTELSAGSGDNHEYAASLGAAANADEARNAIWRELGGELSHGGGAWHYALMGNAWNDPTHMNYMKIGHRIAQEAVEHADPKQRGQIAVFSDHKAINYCSTFATFRNSTLNKGNHYSRFHFLKSGCSWDHYLLEDIDNPDLPDYKIYVFLMSATLTEQQVQYIEKNLQKEGRVLVFLYNAGYYTPGGFEKTCKRLTGLNVHMSDKDCNPVSYAPVGADRMNDSVIYSIFSTRFIHLNLSPRFYLLENELGKQDQPLAKIVGTDMIGAAVHRQKDWTGIYIGMLGGLTPQLIRNIVREAGLEPIAPDGDTVYCGNGILTINAHTEGARTLRISEPKKWIDAVTQETIAENAREINVKMKLHETKIFFLR